MTTIKRFLIFLLPLGYSHATPLPFQDNLNALDSACWSARPNGDQNTAGCGEWKEIGLVRFNNFNPLKARPSQGNIECTYNLIEDECRAQIRFAETDSLWTQFDIKYAADFDFGPGMKIMRWNAGGITDHILYTYSGPDHAGITNMTGVCAEPNGGSGQYGCFDMAFPRGKWIRIKNFLKMNTPGQADGKFRLWVNDTLRIGKDGLGNFRTSLHGFDLVAFGGWYSGPAADNPSVPATYWIDNPRISLKDDFASWPESTTVSIGAPAPMRRNGKAAGRNRPVLFGEDRNPGNGYDSRGRLHKLD
jgi:hypothetical protein